MAQEFDIEIQDPSSGNFVIVTAQLYDDGVYEDYNEGLGDWCEVIFDPVFHNYTYEDLETGATGIMPEAWKGLVDTILCNIYWDREFN